MFCQRKPIQAPGVLDTHEKISRYIKEINPADDTAFPHSAPAQQPAESPTCTVKYLRMLFVGAKGRRHIILGRNSF